MFAVKRILPHGAVQARRPGRTELCTAVGLKSLINQLLSAIAGLHNNSSRGEKPVDSSA